MKADIKKKLINLIKWERKNEKSYKDYPILLGGSDIATLLFVGCYKKEEEPTMEEYKNGKDFFKIYQASTGTDGEYKGYFVEDEDVEIPAHYTLIAKFATWLTVYDDDGVVFHYHDYDKNIEVYQAESGTTFIIKVIDKEIN